MNVTFSCLPFESEVSWAPGVPPAKYGRGASHLKSCVTYYYHQQQQQQHTHTHTHIHTIYKASHGSRSPYIVKRDDPIRNYRTGTGSVRAL